MDACKAATPERAARHRWDEPSQLLQPLGLMGVSSVPFGLRPVEDPQWIAGDAASPAAAKQREKCLFAPQRRRRVRGRAAAFCRGASVTDGPPKHAFAHAEARARARVPHSPPHPAAPPARLRLAMTRCTHPKCPNALGWRSLRLPSQRRQ